MPTTPNGAALNIANGIREFARASAGATAVVDGNRSLTFAEVDERASRLGNHLLASGLQPGARVAMNLGNRLEYPEIACGIAKAGLVSIPINPRLTAPEVSFILKHSGSQALIVDRVLVDASRPGVDAAGIRHVVELDGDYEAVLGASSVIDPMVPALETDPFTICYTAGTTGQPKGVMLSHRSRVLMFYCAGLEWGMGPGRTTLAVAPMYHGAGFVFAYGACATGGTVVMMRSFEPRLLLEMIETHRPSSVFLVPAHIQMLRALGDAAVDAIDSGSLLTIYVNAAPLPQHHKLWLTERFPHVALHELYGSTEAGIVTDLRPPDQLRKERCVGPPWMLNEVRVVGDHGAPVAIGEPGELWSRSPFVFLGYLDDPEATAAATTDDGFVSAGDVAVLDEDGFVYIVDRVRDMVLTGGVNVYPREVEETLHEHPQVADVAVIGLPDEEWGERVVAIVVLAPGAEPDAAPLIAFCRQRLAGFKLPKEVRFVDRLPRNAAGKILKRSLRARQWGP